MGRFRDAPVARAAGGVVVRRRLLTEVLVVHRPRFDDWTLPKGHVDDGESWNETAVREVLEETGVEAVIAGEPSIVSYPLPGERDPLRVKVVAFFPMTPVAEVDHPETRDDHEVDRVEWWSVVRAERELSYDDERALLRSFLADDAWT